MQRILMLGAVNLAIFLVGEFALGEYPRGIYAIVAGSAVATLVTGALSSRAQGVGEEDFDPFWTILFVLLAGYFALLLGGRALLVILLSAGVALVPAWGLAKQLSSQSGRTFFKIVGALLLATGWMYLYPEGHALRVWSLVGLIVWLGTLLWRDSPTLRHRLFRT